MNNLAEEFHINKYVNKMETRKRIDGPNNSLHNWINAVNQLRDISTQYDKPPKVFRDRKEFYDISYLDVSRGKKIEPAIDSEEDWSYITHADILKDILKVISIIIYNKKYIT